MLPIEIKIIQMNIEKKQQEYMRNYCYNVSMYY